VRLSDLTLEEFQAADETLDTSLREVLGVERAVGAFVSYGSTAPAEVAAQLQSWKQKLEALAE
jgi:argininosuccinate lyase